MAGLVVCARCGKHFIGTSAVGNRYRYRYYTCFSRQRYGTKYCDAERLPAEELDTAVLDSLLHVYERTDLFDKAVSAARRRARSQRANHDQELAVVNAGITKAEDAIERYLSAFEAGTLSESQCGKRLDGLAANVRDLRLRREELRAAMEHAMATAPDAGDIAAMRRHIAQALTAARCRPARRSSKPSSTRSASRVATASYHGSACQEARTRRFAPWVVGLGRPRPEPGQSSDGW